VEISGSFEAGALKLHAVYMPLARNNIENSVKQCRLLRSILLYSRRHSDSNPIAPTINQLPPLVSNEAIVAESPTFRPE
jgi:hypothetical protein